MKMKHFIQQLMVTVVCLGMVAAFVVIVLLIRAK